MYFKCKKCRKSNIFLFPWLAGKDYCNECSKRTYDFFIIEKMEAQKNNPMKKVIIKNKPQSFEFYVSYMVVVFIFCAFVWAIFSINKGDSTESNSDVKSCFQDYSRPGAVDCY